MALELCRACYVCCMLHSKLVAILLRGRLLSLHGGRGGTPPGLAACILLCMSSLLSMLCASCRLGSILHLLCKLKLQVIGVIDGQHS